MRMGNLLHAMGCVSIFQHGHNGSGREDFERNCIRWSCGGAAKKELPERCALMTKIILRNKYQCGACRQTDSVVLCVGISKPEKCSPSHGFFQAMRGAEFFRFCKKRTASFFSITGRLIVIGCGLELQILLPGTCYFVGLWVGSRFQTEIFAKKEQPRSGKFSK